MKTTRSLTLTIITFLCALGGAATAQPPPGTIEAEQLFREGRRLMDAGDYRQACDAFEGSLRKDPAISTMLNLGNCREKNQQYASAWAHFIEAARVARAQSGTADLAKVAEERAAQLEPRLSYLIISVSDEARIEGLVITRDDEPVDPAIWNRDIPVDGGTYMIVAKAPAHEPGATTVTVHAATDKKSVNVPKFATTGADRSDGDGAADVDGGGGTGVAAAHGRPGPRLTGKRKLAIAAWSLGAVALGAGVAVELRGRASYDEAQATHDNLERRDLTAAANRDRLYATIAAGVGVAAVATGVYLWLDGKPRRHRARDVALFPFLAADGGSVTLTARF